MSRGREGRRDVFITVEVLEKVQLLETGRIRMVITIATESTDAATYAKLMTSMNAWYEAKKTTEVSRNFKCLLSGNVIYQMVSARTGGL